MNAPWEPMFGPMADDDRFALQLDQVKREQANPQTHQVADIHRATRHGTFDGTHPHTEGARVAGRQNPPPPGQGEAP